MSVRAAILEKLKGSANLAVEGAIDAALPYASAEEQQEFLQVLLARNNRAGWVSLVRHFDRLDPGIQQELMARPRDLFGPLSECVQISTGSARSNVIRIVRQSGQPRFVYLLAEALMDNRAEVRDVAGESLLEVVRQFRASCRAGSEGDAATEQDAARQMKRAMDFVLKQFKSHRQATAATAAMIFERQQDATTWSYFQDSYDELTRCGMAILRAPTDAALAGAIFLGLGSPLKSAAMAGLAGAVEIQLCRKLAEESYRLLDPALREGASTVGQLKMLTTPRVTESWTDETWPGWLRLLEIVGIPMEQRMAWLERMLGDALKAPEQAGWKLAVARVIADTNAAEGYAMLVPLVNDNDERVARFAARQVLRKKNPEWRTHATVLLSSPHLSVQKMVSMDKVGGGDFGKLWHDYPKMPPAVQFTTTRTTAQAEAEFPEQLKMKLASTVTSEVAQGLRMLTQVGNLAEYRGQIIGLCGHGDARIAASAVKLVGRLADPRLQDLLEAAARHEDARVRANAIESMTELHIADKSRQVLTMIHSRHNRERANAIKALSQFDFNTSRDCLVRMLGDSNPLHRVSALWVVDELRVLEILRQVHFIARRDPNLRVRRRAADLLESLNTGLHATANGAMSGSRP